MHDLPIDAATLRSHSAVLRAAAEDLARVADRVGHRVDTMHFEGPAASRFRAQMADRTTRLRRVATEVGDVARIVAQAQQQYDGK